MDGIGNTKMSWRNTTVVGLLLLCLALCAVQRSPRPINDVLYTDGDDGVVVDLGNGNKGIRQTDLNVDGPFDYDTFGFRLPWGKLYMETRLRVDSYSGRNLVPLHIVTCGFASPDNTSVSIALRIRDGRFELCDGYSWKLLDDLGPAVTGEFHTISLLVDDTQRTASLVWDGKEYDYRGLKAQPVEPTIPGWLRFGASGPESSGGTISVTIDWIGVDRDRVASGSPAGQWDYYLDGSQRPVDIGCGRRNILPVSPLVVTGDLGRVVDLGSGNKGLQQKDVNAGGPFDYSTFGMLTPWTEISVQTRFRVDSYSGNEIVPLRILSKGFIFPNEKVSSAAGVALRMRNGNFEVVDVSNGMPIQDLGPVTVGQFNTVGLFVSTQKRTASIIWNGRRLDGFKLLVHPVDPNLPGRIEFGASNAEGRGGCSIVTTDWISMASGSVSWSLAPSSWDYHLDGSLRPADIRGYTVEKPIDKPLGAPGAPPVTTGCLFGKGDLGRIVDLGGGNKGIQQKDANLNGPFDYDTFGLRVPWTEITLQTRFRVDSYSGNYIMPLQIVSRGVMSDDGALCNALGLALRINNGRFELLDASSWLPVKDLGPVTVGQFNTIGLFVSAQKRTASILWNGKKFAGFKLLVQPVDPNLPGKIEFGASGAEGRGGCSTVTTDWIAIANGSVSWDLAPDGWDYYYDGSTRPADTKGYTVEPPRDEPLAVSGSHTNVVDIGNGNMGLQTYNEDKKPNSYSMAILGPRASVEGRFRIDAFKGDDIAPLFVSTGGNKSAVLGVTLRIQNKHLTFYDVRAAKTICDLGPVELGKFHTVHLYLDGLKKTAELTWNGRVRKFTGLQGMADNPCRKGGWVSFGASQTFGCAGTSIVTFDWVRAGQGRIVAGTPDKQWDYHFDGKHRPLSPPNS